MDASCMVAASFTAPTRAGPLRGIQMTRSFKVIVEKHEDDFVAYPLGLKGVVVGEGNSFEEALSDVKSAIEFHIETFGPQVIDDLSSGIEVFVAETGVAV